MSARDGDESARKPATPSRRRRSFLAGRKDRDVAVEPFLIEPPRPEPLLAELPDDDIPVLTEIVSAEEEEESETAVSVEMLENPLEASLENSLEESLENSQENSQEESLENSQADSSKDSPKNSPAPPASPASPGPPVPDELATRMIQAISAQMAYELPTLIEATLLSISEELRQGITSTMETALRDFIAKHGPEDR